MYRPIDAETVKQRNQNWSSRLTISTNPTDPPGMQCSWVYEVRLNPSLSLCRLTDTSVESANLHVVAINFQWFLFGTQNKNSCNTLWFSFILLRECKIIVGDGETSGFSLLKMAKISTFPTQSNNELNSLWEPRKMR